MYGSGGVDGGAGAVAPRARPPRSFFESGRDLRQPNNRM